MSPNTSIDLRSIIKTYRSGTLEVPVLKNVSLTVQKGEMVAIIGPSGSGKSTLMNIIGLLDRPTKGTVRIGGDIISLAMSDRTLAHLRADKIGFVFQSFQLLPRMSALENVLLPTIYKKEAREGRVERAMQILKNFGLKDRYKHKPTELSGGEKQRVAIARALMNDPEIILADEPTGNLDSASGKDVMKVLKDLQAEGKTVVVITHDPSIAEACGRTVSMLDGVVHEGGLHVG